MLTVFPSPRPQRAHPVEAPMKYALVLASATLLAGGAGAQEAVRLSREQLGELLPGAKVAHVAKSSGSHRYWTNDAEGKLYATSDNRLYGSVAGNKSASSPGTWSVSEDGKYCVSIEWKRAPESWCAAILKGDDGAYYLNRVDPASRIDFTR